MACKTQRGFDVLGLGAFVTTCQQNNQFSSALPEIHPVTGSVIDPQLRYAFANGFDIAGVAGGEPFDPCLDARPGLKIAQAVEPLHEQLGFADFNQAATVAVWLHVVNGIRAGTLY